MDCIFCKLANKEIPTEVVYEDEDVFAFKDQEPKAPIHYLFIPKKHINSFQELDDSNIFEKISRAIILVAEREGFSKKGYRVVTNVGEDGGQVVKHLHFHVLAGTKLSS